MYLVVKKGVIYVVDDLVLCARNFLFWRIEYYEATVLGMVKCLAFDTHGIGEFDVVEPYILKLDGGEAVIEVEETEVRSPVQPCRNTRSTLQQWIEPPVRDVNRLQEPTFA